MGLPVRRVDGTKGRVFAICHELDIWLQSSTTWCGEGNDCELARLRKKVTELLLENEMLRRELRKFEAIRSPEPNFLGSYSTSKGPSEELASCRRESNRVRNHR